MFFERIAVWSKSQGIKKRKNIFFDCMSHNSQGLLRRSCGWESLLSRGAKDRVDVGMGMGMGHGCRSGYRSQADDENERRPSFKIRPRRLAWPGLRPAPSSRLPAAACLTLSCVSLFVISSKSYSTRSTCDTHPPMCHALFRATPPPWIWRR